MMMFSNWLTTADIATCIVALATLIAPMVAAPIGNGTSILGKLEQPTCDTPPNTNTGSPLTDAAREDIRISLAEIRSRYVEAGRADCVVRGLSQIELVQRLNTGIKQQKDGAPLTGQETAAQFEQHSTKILGPMIFEIDKDATVGTRLEQFLPEVEMARLKSLPSTEGLRRTLKVAVRWGYYQTFSGDRTRIGEQIKIFDSTPLQDLVMWINEVKSLKVPADARRLAYSSVAEDLLNLMTIGDLKDLCDALSKKALDWSSIRWPDEDTYRQHQSQIQAEDDSNSAILGEEDNSVSAVSGPENSITPL